MQTSSPSPTRTQIDCSLRYLELLLVWVLGLASGANSARIARGYRRWLTLLWRLHGVEVLDALLRSAAGLLAALIVCRADPGDLEPSRAPARRPVAVAPGFVRTRRRSAFLRALIGAKLRRRLRARGFSARLQALFAALRDIDALTAAMRRRMTRRLTRLASIVPARPPATRLLGRAALRPACADSS